MGAIELGFPTAQESLSRPTIAAGAVLPVDGASLARTIETRLSRPAATWPTRDAFLTVEQPAWTPPQVDVPVLVRGDARIVPLAWDPHFEPTNGRRVFVPTTLAEKANDVWATANDYLSHHRGWPISVDAAADTESPREYSRALAELGATRARWFGIGDHAVVLVITGGRAGELRTIAVHIVPRGWAADHEPSEMPLTELAWSWSDVVDLADPPAGAR